MNHKRRIRKQKCVHIRWGQLNKAVLHKLSLTAARRSAILPSFLTSALVYAARERRNSRL
jgi:hypothetical protein